MVTTESVDVTDGSRLPLHVARPQRAASRVGVIVAHELFGVSPDIAAVVEDLAAAGHVAVAPEFYHRTVPAGRWFARDDDGRREGFGALHALTREHAVADVAAAARWLHAQPGVEEIAIVGFSAGGHLAYLAATQLPLSRVAVLYGGWLTSTDIALSQPAATVTLTSGITGRVLYLVGQEDTLVDAAQRTAIDDALSAAGVPHELVVYPGVQHAFFWPGTPAYDADARTDAWRRVCALLAD